MTTPRLGAPELVQNQAVPETTVNEMAFLFDAGSGGGFLFLDRGLNTPPGAPVHGDTYLVGGTPTGAWTGHANEVAIYFNTAWTFRAAKEGWIARVADENLWIGYDGAAWNTLSVGGGVPTELDDLTDVNAPSPTAGQVLTWDDTPGEWVAATPASTYTDEMARDAIGAALAEGAGIDITVNDGGDTITIAATGGSSGVYDANWFDVTAAPYNATGDGSTDDTAAIQAAIDACETAGGGTVYFPRGVYVINGALQDTSRSNAQLLLPRRDYVDTESITIELRGECAPPTIVSVIGATPVADNLSVIKGTLNIGTGALIGAHGPVGTTQDFTNILLVMRNLRVQMPTNPTLTALDLSCVAQIDIDNVIVDTGSWDVAGHSAMTTATSYGIRCPARYNGAVVRLGNVHVGGFYKGYQFNEHTNGLNVNAWACRSAFEFTEADHSSVFTRLVQHHCQNGMVFTGGPHNVQVMEYNVEHAASGTWTTTNDISDASNYARGNILWHVVLASTGIDHNFTVSGGVNATIRRLHQPTSGTSFPSNPRNGDRFYRTDQNTEFFYQSSGSRWLSTQAFTATYAILAAAATTGAPVAIPFVDTYDIYIEVATVVSQISSATTGTNYFTWQWLSVNGSNATSNIGSSQSAQSDPQNNLVTRTQVIGAVVDMTSSQKRITCLFTRAGAGTGNFEASISYRIVGA